MKPRFAQNRVCIKGYVTTDKAERFKRLSMRLGMSTSEHMRFLIEESVNEERKLRCANETR